ncbi:MAG: adenylosuccinate lyase [Anaerolineales bacterium]|nr:adenylosuccinate lyase [Anaerolineales bacterium]
MSYQSPFSVRYGSEEMRLIWAETTKRRLWRRIWVAQAETLAGAGLVEAAALDELKAHVNSIDLAQAAELETRLGHELVAELQTYAGQCPKGGRFLHWGLTSADVLDNADVLLQRTALTLLLGRLREVLLAMADRIEATADLVVLGYTHLQPAEPTTLGYRLAAVGQDLLAHFQALSRQRADLRGKGVKGAVGTGAPFSDLLENTSLTPSEMEARILSALGLESHPVTGQTYTRLQDLELLSALSALAATLHKFAFDMRLMQSPGVRTASEPFGEAQVGSSAMPFKQNPVQSEKVCSLARVVAAAVQPAWHNAASTLLERTLDDSANRRVLIPEAFLAMDEMLLTSAGILRGMTVDAAGAQSWLAQFGPFAAVERVLIALVRAGADRQEMHERLRQHSLAAWPLAQQGHADALLSRLAADTSLLRYLQPARIEQLLEVRTYVGWAPERARQTAAALRRAASSGEPRS